MLSRSEAERINVPKPDPSLSKISPTSSSPTIISSSPTSASLKESTLLKRDQQAQTSFNQNALPHAGKFVPLAASIQRPVAMPTSYVLPVVPYRFLHSSLHHTQDSLGQYDYSYTGDSSAKTESRSLDGTTRGAYSYIDPNGILQQVHYIADHNGFRVLATNLPEAKWWWRRKCPAGCKSVRFRKKNATLCVRDVKILILVISTLLYFFTLNFNLVKKFIFKLEVYKKKLKYFYKFRACQIIHFNRGIKHEKKKKKKLNWCSSCMYLNDFIFI